MELYKVMISWGMDFSCIFMYSKQSSRLLLMVMYLAFGVDKTLFQWILMVSMSAVSVVTMPG